MTAVVGILNKRGLAIAADSAVTRERPIAQDEKEEKKATQELEEEQDKRANKKITKNGNKMIRLNEELPVAVMITGNADFLGVPWDVIVRRYRQRRGKRHYPSIEACVTDFFDYIASNDVFWDKERCNLYLNAVVQWLFKEAMDEIAEENDRYEDFSMKYPEKFKKAFSRSLSRITETKLGGAGSPHFRNCPIRQFRRDVATELDKFFRLLTISPFNQASCITFPRGVVDAVRPYFEEALLATMGSIMKNEACAELVFAGYGKDQEYPSLISAVVCEGYAHRVNYSITNNININDDRPVAICPFAQDDVVRAILQGMHEPWEKNVVQALDKVTRVDYYGFTEEDAGCFQEDLLAVDIKCIERGFNREGGKLIKENEREWERCLERYDPEDLAVIADSFIDLTGLHRALTFRKEEVGGIVDLAVITKGHFEWLRRKGWYHRDQHGKDGSMGI